MIGIKHGQKKQIGKDQPAQPTYVCVTDEVSAALAEYELWSDDHEMDFLLGHFPIEYAKTSADTDLAPFNPRQIKWRKLKAEDDEESAPLNLRREQKVQGSRKTITMVATGVPVKFDGLQKGDTALTILGGSGDYFRAALAERIYQIGGRIYQMPAYVLAERAGKDRDKSKDAKLLTLLFQQEPHMFYFMEEQDKHLVMVRDATYALLRIMKDRIACEQSIVQRLRSEAFQKAAGQSNGESVGLGCPLDCVLLSDSGAAQLYEQALEEDVIYQGMMKKEVEAEKRVAKLLNGLDVYQLVFAPIKGCGTRIAMRIIAAVADIRRFPRLPSFWKFCGLHVENGIFPRKRKGERFPGNPLARQAFYLFAADQCNKMPDSPGGQLLRAYKAKFRAQYPEPIVVNGKKRFTDSHIHKRAIWRTATKFGEYVYKSWRWVEQNRQGKACGAMPKLTDPQVILAGAQQIIAAREAQQV